MSGKLERITLGKIEDVVAEKSVQMPVWLGEVTIQERAFSFNSLKLIMRDQVLAVPVPLREQTVDIMDKFLRVIDTYLAEKKQYLAQISELGTKWPDIKYVKGELYQE